MKIWPKVNKTLDEIKSLRARRAFRKQMDMFVLDGLAVSKIVKGVTIIDCNEHTDGKCHKCNTKTSLWMKKQKKWVCEPCIKTWKKSKRQREFIEYDARVRKGMIPCEQCGLTEWRSVKLRLHIHHLDENHDNDALSNLRVLCPNCHTIEHVIKSNTYKNEDAAARL
jgi:Zn finger protein HypA/HybF involved in hydrogenase expression